MIRPLAHAIIVGVLSLVTLVEATGATASPRQQIPARAAAQLPRPDEPRPELRAGINERQLQRAITLVEAGQELGLPRRAYVVAVATALQESRLEVLANVNVPNSFDYQPRDGYGRDHDSVGIFQQRVTYHCVNDLQYCMDPRYSALKFYNDLRRIDGWEQLPVTDAAQLVQGSAFPGHYARHHGAAELIVDAILEWQQS